MKNYPKILIVSRLCWDDNSVSNTLTNLFEDYDNNSIARICIETQFPNTKCCKLFYHISEISLVKKLWRWNLKTGRVLHTDGTAKERNETVDQLAKEEQSVMNFVRRHRSMFFNVLRDLLWGLNGWKSKELDDFVKDFDPDVVWLDGSPLILMNRENNYILSVANKPAVTFLMDDVYSYESCTSLAGRIYRFFLRKQVAKTVSQCSHVFVSSLKMKKEYDEAFGIGSTFITKSFDTSLLRTNVETIHKPLRMVYLGNLLIGRLDSLIAIAECLKEINKEKQRVVLSVFSNTLISDKQRQRLLIDDGVSLLPPVPYSDVPGIVAGSDVQVFTESMDSKNMSVARLSFSTKIVDYLKSGKCILAVGSDTVAPIEYFSTEDAALVATNTIEIRECIEKLLDDSIVREYAEKAVACCKRNHEKVVMHERIYSILRAVAEQK